MPLLEEPLLKLLQRYFSCGHMNVHYKLYINNLMLTLVLLLLISSFFEQLCTVPPMSPTTLCNYCKQF